jgi:hypothetical protein
VDFKITKSNFKQFEKDLDLGPTQGPYPLQHKVHVVVDNVNIILYKNKTWLCNWKCNQNYIFKLAFKDQLQATCSCIHSNLCLVSIIPICNNMFEKKSSLVKKFFTKMHMVIFKGLANWFHNLDFIKYRMENIFSSSMLPKIWKMANSSHAKDRTFVLFKEQICSSGNL